MDEKARKEQFECLIDSYLDQFPELKPEIIEKALRQHAKNFSGCIACVFSRCYKPREYEDIRKEQLWLRRTCILGLSQGTCGCFEPFPKP